jgi:uncharacterized protein (TIGR02466 family)
MAPGLPFTSAMTMEKHAYNLFPTPVHFFKEVLSAGQIAIIRRHCLDAEAAEHGAFVGGTKSSFGRDARLIDELESTYSSLAGLKKGLTQLIREFGAGLGFNNLAMDNSWFNVQYPGSILKHHLHSDATVSAALCIHADEMSSALHLESPNPILGLIKPDTYTECTFESVKFALAPGEMLLFPSWIKHGSGFEPNQSEHRIVISINAR